MNSLLSNIETLLKGAFEEYIIAVASKYALDKEELEELWNGMNINMKINIKKSAVSQPETKAKKLPIETGGTVGSCQYILKRGRVGERCGGKPYKGSQTYCSKHKKSEVQNPEPKPVSKLPTTSRILKLNKEISKYVHAESGLYVVSKEDSTVVGSYREGILNDFLTSEDISLCEKFGFKYDANLIRKEETKVEDDLDMLEKQFENMNVNIEPVAPSPKVKKTVLLDEEPITLKKTKTKPKPSVDVKTIENAKKIASTILSTIPNVTELKEKKKIEDILKDIQVEETKNDSDSDIFTSDGESSNSDFELEEDI